jgi:hypothetical protein
MGYNFKSPLIRYNIPSNKNGKMTAQAYVDKIPKPVVKPWIQNDLPFVLEEDRDSSHGVGKGNTTTTKMVKTWKENNGLQSYFNCSGSPDFAPIKNVWQPCKQYVCKYPHWDKRYIMQLAEEGWEGITLK